MYKACSAYRILLLVYVSGFAIRMALHTDTRAVAQEAEATRSLERVDVQPPARSTAPTASGRDYEDPSAFGPQGSSDRTSQPSVFAGTGIPSSTLSLVTGKSGVSLRAESLPSQVNIVTARDIQGLVVRNFSDLFRQVSGLNPVWYGQGNIGFAFGMRGFVGQHGKDSAVFVDGVPQNIPSASQGTSGMVNFAWLTPEVIERIEIIKGPFSALYGDFALAGAVNIVTKKAERSPQLIGEGGSFGYGRALAVLSSYDWSPAPYLVNELYRIDGYRDNSWEKKWNTFDKISFPLLGGLVSLRFNYSTSDWGAPSYLVIADVKAGVRNRRGAINVTDGGDHCRWGVVMNYAPLSGERGLYASVYWDRYALTRFSTNPLPQQAQVDDRQYWGTRLFYNMVFWEQANLTAGLEYRRDKGTDVQFRSITRTRTATTRYYELDLRNWAWFLQGQVMLADSFKLVGGVRGDYFRDEVVNTIRPTNSGTANIDGIISPKIGFVITPTENFNIYGNVANGFRSPSAVEMSPITATGKKDFGLPQAGITSADLGFNAALFGRFYLTADYYHTTLEREIQTINNQQVPIGDTTRKGFEVEGRYFPSSDISIFGNYAWVDAKNVNPVNAGQYLIPMVPEHIIKGGLKITRDLGSGRQILADLYYQYNSGAPYYPVANRRDPTYGPDYDQYNMKLAYDGSGWSGFLAAQCQPREYASQFVGTTSGRINFDPQPKWNFTSGLTYQF